MGSSTPDAPAADKPEEPKAAKPQAAKAAKPTARFPITPPWHPRPAPSDPDQLNIMLAGKTGAGKSTLINAVLGQDVADVGTVAPVTMRIDRYKVPGAPMRIYDVRGLELRDAVRRETMRDMNKVITKAERTPTPNDDIHLLWYCVQSVGARLEKAEADFIREMSKRVTVIVVLTKSYSATEARNLMTYVLSLIDSGDLLAKAVVPVVAKDWDMDGVVKAAFGLEALTELSYELLPEAQRRILARAQRVERGLKRRSAWAQIARASAKALAAAAIPLRVDDSDVLAPIQEQMLRRIAEIYNVKPQDSDLATLVASLLHGLAPEVVKKAMVALVKHAKQAESISKLDLPVDLISGAVAAAITFALGGVFVLCLEAGLDRVEISPDTEADLMEILNKAFGGTESLSLSEFLQTNFKRLLADKLAGRDTALTAS
jgi:predicted GTPase